MRILNRPMFKYGGPIKQGIMHGMRNGGRAAALVGNPVYPKTDGREHHFWNFALQGAARALPYAAKAWKYIKPTSIPRNIVTKSKSTLPIGMRGTMGSRTTTTPRSNWQMSKEWMKANPGYTATGALSAYNAPGTYGAVKGAGGLGWKALKQAADLAVPDWIWDQDKWEKERAQKKIISGIEKPGGYPGPTVPDIPKIKKKTAAERAAEDKSERKARLARYLDEMGYDKAKKTAIGDALIDASAIVQQGTEEAGSLKHADWGKMINKAIQTTSKRMDKPEQIREAIGLMLTKAGIDKEFREDDAFTKKWKALNLDDPENYAAWKKQQLGTSSFMENVAIANKAGATGQSMYDQAAKMTADVNFRGNIINKSDFGEILEKQKKETGLDDITIVENYTQSLLDQYPENFNDGDYTVGENLVTIKDDKIISVR